jgi:quercetin 2,3-dioxygenase
VHFLQIWIQPSSKGIASSYEQKHFGAADKRGRLRLVASPDAADGSVLIHQDARVYASCSTRAMRRRSMSMSGGASTCTWCAGR